HPISLSPLLPALNSYRGLSSVVCGPGFLLSHVLVDEHRVPVGIVNHEIARAGRGLVRLGLERHPLGPELALQFAYVGEGVERLRVAVPAEVERQDVALEHPLEQPDDAVAVLQY